MRNKWTKDFSRKNQVKKTKLMPLAWIKLPTDLLDEPRIEQLILNEGMKGLGFYIRIICKIYSRKSRCISEDEITKMTEKGISIKPMLRVYKNYGLFEKDEFNHVFSSIDFAQSDEKDLDKFSEKLSSPTPAPAYYKKEKENKKNDYHHSKKSDDDDADDAPKQMKKAKKAKEKPMPSIYRSEPMEPVLMDPIKYLRSLTMKSAWAEAMLQTLGKTNPALRNLVLNQWEETKAFLALHMASQDKASLLLSEHDVKRYFTNCLNNTTVAQKLQNHLATLRAKEIERQQEEMQRRMELECTGRAGLLPAQ